MKDCTTAADNFAVLSDVTRLLLLHLLGKGERSVQDLADAAQRPRCTVSAHLSTLYSAGFVSRRRQGKQAIYMRTDAVWAFLSEQAKAAKV